jgi:hypothetical protein
MNTRDAFDPIRALSVRSLARAAGAALALALLLVPALASADEDRSGWSFRFTPVIVPSMHGYDVGGGVDPEIGYTVDRGSVRIGAGLRVGGYYATSLFGVVAMPTLRLTVPVGPVEPYAAFGTGFGWVVADGHQDIASLSRLGVVFRISSSLALGVEGSVQKIDGSRFRFPSLGSSLSFDL